MSVIKDLNHISPNRHWKRACVAGVHATNGKSVASLEQLRGMSEIV